MAGIFLKIVNMSISACWIVLAILLFRFVLKKAPKWINCVLWGIAGLRLIMPFSFESILSLIPSAEFVPQELIHSNSSVNVSGTEIFNYIGNNPVSYDLGISNGSLVFTEITAPDGNYVNPLLIITSIASIVWVIGIAALLIYTIISFIRLKSKIGTAILLRDNIYQSESVVSPFVLGIIKPKIYLPFNMNGQNMDHVIAHEQAHIRRKDHLWKPLGFLILTLHWFNPMVWLGYILLCRDIELACDEKVVKELNNEQRADYSEALLACSVNRRMIAACPLAFGEVGVKDRIKSVLNYKKPAFWIIVVAIVVSITVAVCFLTNPVNTSIYNSSYETGKCLYSYVVSADKETKSNELVFDITSDGKVYKIFGDGTTDELGVLKESDYTAEELEAAIKNQDAKLNIGNIKNAYELSDCIFLQKSNGTVYLVQFFSDGRIMSVFKLNRIGKSDIPSFSNAEKLTWTYQPMLSFTGHSFKAISLDFDYTHVEATCMGGEFCSLDVDGQPCGTKMHFEKDNTVYWTPKEAVIENIPQKSELTLEIYNDETQIHKCIIVFECVSRDIAKAEFEIYFKDSDGLKMIYDNGIKLVEQGSVSNVGGADNPNNIIFSVDSKQLKEKYPQFFNVSTDGGLTVYIWQMSKDNYSCYLANTSMEATSDNSFAYDVGATISEMRAILTTYDIDQKDITVQPVINPLSSYCYEIDDTYRTKVKELFWKDSSNVDISNNSQSVTKTKSIERIVDHSVDDGVSYDNALELFYTDDKYNYYFSNIISQYIIVEFDDGTKNNVKDALTAGEITISDLDKFEIQYSKTEKSVQPGANPYFNAEVLEVTAKSILVKPDDDSKETKSADKIYVSLDVISEIPVPTINAGDRVRVIYNGEIAETYPAQINNVFVIYLLGENNMVLSPTPLQ